MARQLGPERFSKKGARMPGVGLTRWMLVARVPNIMLDSMT
jgi:hypothetical protein